MPCKDCEQRKLDILKCKEEQKRLRLQSNGKIK